MKAADPTPRAITLHKWCVIQNATVTIQQQRVQPVILAEFRISGKRQVHCMFQHPDDNEWKAVAHIPAAVLNASDVAFIKALSDMKFQVPHEAWN
jgi:hypothetical protein